MEGNYELQPEQEDEFHEYGGGREVLYVYYPIEAYRDGVAILRNEKPVVLTYEKTMGYARVETGGEPVGEGENNN
jgi:hypothetical protein